MRIYEIKKKWIHQLNIKMMLEFESNNALLSVGLVQSDATNVAHKITVFWDVTQCSLVEVY
jgi:hypothetical protein